MTCVSVLQVEFFCHEILVTNPGFRNYVMTARVLLPLPDNDQTIHTI